MQIFISYASKNRDVVKKLAEDLTDLGHDIWFDKELSGGQQWWDQILTHLRKCDLFVFALTEEALESEPCRRERRYAYDLNKRILPILLNDVNTNLLPPELALIQFVDYRSEDKKAAIALNRALNLLPPAQSLPDPLPEPPPVPVSPLSDLRARISASSLDANEQRLLAAKLSDYLRSDETSNDARTLLHRLRRHPDLLATVDREIGFMLQGEDAKQIKPRLLVIRRAEFYTALFSPNGKQVIAGTEDSMIRIWDLVTGEEIDSFKVSNEVDRVAIIAISKDSELVLLIASEGLTLWDIISHQETMRFDFPPKFRPEALSVSLDFKYIVFGGSSSSEDVSSSERQFIIWSIDTGEIISQFTIPEIAEISRIAFYSENSPLLVLGDENQTIFYINHFDGIITNEIHFNNVVRDFSFLSGGNEMVILFESLSILTAKNYRWEQSVEIYDISKQDTIQTFHYKHDSNQLAGRLKLAASGKYIVIRLDDRSLVVLSENDKMLFSKSSHSEVGHTEDLFDLTSDGRFVLAKSGYGILLVVPSNEFMYNEMEYPYT